MDTLEPCRFGTGCWRPLCPYGHSGRSRAARWAALWTLLASQEAEDDLEVVKVIPLEATTVDDSALLAQPGDKLVEIPQIQYTDKVIAVPFMIQRQASQIQTAPMTGETRRSSSCC